MHNTIHFTNINEVILNWCFMHVTKLQLFYINGTSKLNYNISYTKVIFTINKYVKVNCDKWDHV